MEINSQHSDLFVTNNFIFGNTLRNTYNGALMNSMEEFAESEMPQVSGAAAGATRVPGTRRWGAKPVCRHSNGSH